MIGASDTNSRKAPILPWLRSLDGLNTHDNSYALAIAGGVTSAQILPGSRNNIGTNQLNIESLLIHSLILAYRWTSLCDQVAFDGGAVRNIQGHRAPLHSQWHRL